MLDALDWVSGDWYQLLDQAVLIRSTSLEFAGEVRRLLGNFAAARPAAGGLYPTLSCIVSPPAADRRLRPFHFLYADCVRVGRVSTLEELLRGVAEQFEALVAGRTRAFHLFHGTAAARDGLGLLLPDLPPPDGAGVSALLPALRARGFSLLACTKVAVDVESGALVSYSGPWEGDAYRPQGNRGHGAVPIRQIIVVERRPRTTARLVSLPRSAAVGALIKHSANFNQFGQDALPLLVRIAQHADCYTVTGSDLDKMAGLVTANFSRSPRSSVPA